MASSDVQTPVDIEFDAQEQRHTLFSDLQIDVPRPGAEIRRWAAEEEERIQKLPLERQEVERAKYMMNVARMREVNRRKIYELEGIDRLDKGFAPVNAESNDLYQFRMASVYLGESPKKRGTFVLYYRNPKDAAGIRAFGMSRALQTLKDFKFDEGFLYGLLQEGKITKDLHLECLKLTKLDINVRAVRDGEFVGPNTPLMLVEGPLWQMQLVETTLLQCLDYASGVATRAAAICAIAEKPLIDFTARRAPGEEAAVTSSLASVTNGAVGIANTITPLVARRNGLKDVKSMGTTAHALTKSYFEFDAEGNCLTDPALSELKTYYDYIKYFPSTPVILIDTIKKSVGLGTAKKIYDVLGGKLIGVRDDSNISGEGIIRIYDTLKKMEVENFFIVISDNLTPQSIRKIREDIEQLRGKDFYKNLDLRLGVGTYLARPEPVGMVFKLAEWTGEDGRVHRVSKASATEDKASFPPVLTYREMNMHGLIRDFNVLPEEANQYPNFRVLQEKVDLSREDLHLLRPYAPDGVHPGYLNGSLRTVQPIFTEKAHTVRARIQKALKDTQPLIEPPGNFNVMVRQSSP